MEKKKVSLESICEQCFCHGVPRAVANAILGLKKQIEDELVRMQAKWAAHLKEEKGSCYCMASETSCLPQMMETLEKVLGRKICHVCGGKRKQKKADEEGDGWYYEPCEWCKGTGFEKIAKVDDKDISETVISVNKGDDNRKE